MKRLFVVILVLGLMSVLVQGATTAAQMKPDLSTPESVVHGFFDAEKMGHVSLMKAYAQDESFTDEQSQTEAYLENFQHNPLLDYQIISSNRIDNTHVQFTVRETYQSTTDQLPDLTYTAFEENGVWKLLILPYVINMNKASADYKKVKILNGKIQVADPVGQSYTLTTVFSERQMASQTPEQVVSSYIKAMKNGNVAQIMACVIDKRFSDEQSEKAGYERMAQHNDFVDGKMLALKSVDENNKIVTLQITEKQNGTFEMAFPMTKQDGQWKIVITGQEIPAKK